MLLLMMEKSLSFDRACKELHFSVLIKSKLMRGKFGQSFLRGNPLAAKKMRVSLWVFDEHPRVEVSALGVETIPISILLHVYELTAFIKPFYNW